MVKCYYDLHIHSSLSPCGDELMTITNILNMAKIKGLDIISITDHNSAKNINALLKAATDFDILVIPGIEVESYEGIHLLCYFRNIDDMNKFDDIIYQYLPEIKNNEKLFGQQIILNHFDEEIGREDKMLINSINLKMDEIIEIVHKLNGIVFTAHIDKYANSILTILGFIPKDLKVNGIEITKNLVKAFEYSNYKLIQNSDAHYIADICERLNYIELEEKTIDAFFKYFEG